MYDQPKFGVFDKEAETDVEIRHLPHWFQPGTSVFITLRTADSLPRSVILQWHEEIHHWLRLAGLSIQPGDPLPVPESLPENLQKPYRKHRDRLWHWHLDSCLGSCLLRRRDLADIVLKSLLHFNGDRYDLASAIIMPNHAHLIAQFYSPTTCRKQCRSWMHFSARKVNQLLGLAGEFWQSEPFDHLIRTEAQFHYLQNYIAQNGRTAGLPETDFLHWRFD
jgi:putative transposase